MAYRIADLIRLSGFNHRAIRRFTTNGLLPSIRFLGPATVYGEEHLATLLAIKRLKRESRLDEHARKALAQMKGAELLRYAGLLPPEPPPEPPPKAPEVSAHALDSSPRMIEPHAQRDHALARLQSARASRWIRVELMLGLELSVNEDASGAALNAASEIALTYGKKISR
jgi:DNA-binding transcriptional MerR regulator